MSALSNILKKEIRELLTPAIILPVVFVAILFSSLGGAIGGIEDEISEPPIVGLIVEDTGVFGQDAATIIRQNAKVIYNSTSISDVEEGVAKIQQEEGNALIHIPGNFTEHIQNNTKSTLNVYWVMKGAGVFDTLSSVSLEGILSSINRNISTSLISHNTSVNASVVLQPTSRFEITYFKGKELPGVSPGTIANVLTQQSLFIPIIMMLIILMAGNMVITSMAFEKENKTLETLLTLPVKRTSIVTGKIAASAIVGLLLSVVYMFGMGSYLGSLTGLSTPEAGVALPATLFSFTTIDVILIGVSLFITLIAALAFCMLLGTMAKNYKSVQTLIFPVVMLTIIPMFITMFADFDTLPFAFQALVFAIPFSHPMMAPRALLFNNYALVIGGIVYVAIVAVIIIAIVVWIFKTDRLLTGSIRWRTVIEKWKQKR